MIAHLRGRLEATGIDHAVIDVGGVGYLVGASAKTLAAIGPVGEAATLFTEMLVAEDSIRLVGFARPDERDWFRLLTGVQGVGARVALAILSVLEPVELAKAVGAQDKAMVARANGVGPKLAERIVRELKDKVGGVIPGSLTPVAAAMGAALVTTIQSGPRAINSRAAATTSSIDDKALPTSSSSSKWFGVMPSAKGTSRSRYCWTNPSFTYRPSLRSPMTGSMCTFRSGREARSAGSQPASSPGCT